LVGRCTCLKEKSFIGIFQERRFTINSVAILIERAANITSALFTAIGIARAETVSVRRACVAAPSRDVAFAVALPVEWIADRAAARHGAAIVAVAGRAAVGIVGVK